MTKKKAKKTSSKKVSTKKSLQIQASPSIEVDTQSLILAGMKEGVNIEVIERLMDLRNRLVEEEAARSFRIAMSDFQSRCPVIKKNKKVLNKDGKTVRFRYAPIDDIFKQIAPLLSECGLSYDIMIENDYEHNTIVVIVNVSHVQGYIKTTSFSVPIDPDAYMNPHQKMASAATYAKRHAFCNAFGIITGDEDTDTNDITKNMEEEKVDEKKSKIDALPKVIKDGFKIINYNTVGVAYTFCERFGWDEKVILREINKIVDANG